MHIINDIRIEEVIDENPMRGRLNLDTVRKIVYTVRVYNSTTAMWYEREGNILVSVGYRSFQGVDDVLAVTKIPRSSKHVYQADLVVMTRFSCDIFTVPKNRWGVDGGRYSRGIDLGYFLLDRGLDGFEMSDRELLWENILKALSDVTGHSIDYVKDKERFISGFKLRPRYNPKRVKFE